MLVELTTAKGYKFWAESLVTINGVDYALNEMTEEQRNYICDTCNAAALNAVFAGERVYHANVRPFEEVFADILEGRGKPAEYQEPWRKR